MTYLAGAKLVVFAHFAFLAFVFLGALLFATHRWVVWLHAPCLVYAVAITVIGSSCPLTHLERWLLRRAGVPAYSGEFLSHYVWSRFGLTGSELPVAAGIIVAAVGANALQYWTLFHSRL